MANRFLVAADGIDEPSWLGNVEPFLQKMAAELGFDGQEASLVFCGDEMIRELNKNYRDIDSPTDILSFENRKKSCQTPMP